ncbi:MAG: hypothetical protein SPG61_00915, partial [Arcanobacterium sp.]|nr:hypothetical protein [Arcanobacterium sp.]
PASITGVIGALLAISTLKLAGVSLASPAQLIFLALIAAIAFVAIHQALIVTLGVKIATVASVILLVLQVLTLAIWFPAQSYSGAIGAIREFLPLPVVKDAFHYLIYGSGLGSPLSASILCIILAILASLATIAGHAKHRQVTLEALREEVNA